MNHETRLHLTKHVKVTVGRMFGHANGFLVQEVLQLWRRAFRKSGGHFGAEP